MDKKTYSLRREGESISNRYYEDVAIASKKVINDVLNCSEYYIRDYMKFIKNENIEELRSINEYAIELLLIGVLFNEYIDNARAFKNIPKKLFSYLNNLRNNEKVSKKRVDAIRGILNSKILRRKLSGRDYADFKGLLMLREWLKATNDFNEEIYRIDNWIEFFKIKEKKYIDNILYLSIEMAKHMFEIGEEYLWYYVKDVYEYLEKLKSKKCNREDIIYCSKTEIQYYFNMIGAEIMNLEYREKFLETTERVIFLPTCMRQTKKECKSILTSKGLRCKGCSNVCNINKVNKIAKEEGDIVYIIPHESSMFKLINYDKKKGMIGIACVLNLMSGGWKAIRIGYIPQCVILDSSGCKHWKEEQVMTSINFNKLRYSEDREYKKANR